MLQHHNNLNNLIRERERETRNLSNNNKHLSFYSLYSCYLNQFKSAFSLVELSIVLIIIGLLISAVISGKALIDQAKINVIMREVETIRMALLNYIDDGKSLTTMFSGNIKMNIDQLLDTGYLPYDGTVVNNGYSDHVYKSKVSNNAWYPTNFYGGVGYNTKNKYCSSVTTTPNKNGKQAIFEATYYKISTKSGDANLDPIFCDKLADKIMSHYGESINSSNLNKSQANKILACCGKNSKDKSLLYIAIFDPYV